MVRRRWGTARRVSLGLALSLFLPGSLAGQEWSPFFLGPKPLGQWTVLEGGYREEARGRFEATFLGEEDSNHNFLMTAGIGGEVRLFSFLAFQGEVFSRNLEQTEMGMTRGSWGGRGAASLLLGPGWRLSAGGGGTETNGSRVSGFTTLGAEVATPERYRLGLRVKADRFPLDATARLVERGVEVELLDVVTRWDPSPDWHISGSGGVGRFLGEAENRRYHGAMGISGRVVGGWTLGLGAQFFGFSKDLRDPYFDPDFYGLAELSLGWIWQPGWLGISLRAAPGVQQVHTEGDPQEAFRGAAGLKIRMGVGREISLSGAYSSARLQSFSTEDPEYRHMSVVASGRWVF